MRSIAFPSALALTAFGILAGCASGNDDVAGSGGSAAQGGAGGNAPMHFTAFALPAKTYSHGEPSALEQKLLELTQAVRANPPAAGPALISLPEAQGAIGQFGVNTQQVVSDFNGYTPVPPLAFDPKLLASSKFHSEDMAKNGFQEHDGSGGEHFFDRIKTAGYQYSFCSENIFSYAKSPEHCNAALLIDWGNPELGHRLTLLDIDGAKRDIGISIVEHPASSAVGPLVVTEDFGEPISDKHRYLVGVAYKDMNQNGIYDAGEGLAGMNIVPNAGDTYAVTSMSGGFAIPFTVNAGAFKVQIQDAQGVALDQKDTSLAADNVKVDFVIP